MEITNEQIGKAGELNDIADRIGTVNKSYDLYYNKEDDFFKQIHIDISSDGDGQPFKVTVNSNPSILISEEMKNAFVQALKSTLPAIKQTLSEEYNEKITEINALQNG